MAISKGEPCGAIVVRGGLINPRGRMRIEKPCIVNAAGMLIQIDPRFGRPRVTELTRLFDVFVKGIPRAAFGVARANADVAGYAPGAFSPASVPLRSAHVNIGRAFEHILTLAEV